MTERLSTPLQMDHLKRVFKKNNPDVDTDMIDWSIIDTSLTYSETVEAFGLLYPQFDWSNGEDYNEYYIDDLKTQASVAGYDLVNRRTLRTLENKAQNHDRLRERVKKLTVKDKQDMAEEGKQFNKIGYDKDKLLTVFNSLQEKPLAVVGEGDWGKSTAVKNLVQRAINNGYIVKVFDISMVWKYNIPLKQFQVCLSVVNYENLENCVYDISLLGNDERRILIASIIYEDWLNQRDGLIIDQNYVETHPRILYIFDEGSSYLQSRSLNKADHWGSVLTDFVGAGRNYGQDAIIISRAISGEIATKYRRKCNYLLGRIMGDEEVRYIRNGTSKRFVEVAKKLQQYHFIYYGRNQIDKPFTFPYSDDYGEPLDITPIPEPVKPVKQLTKKQRFGILSRILG